MAAGISANGKAAYRNAMTQAFKSGQSARQGGLREEANPYAVELDGYYPMQESMDEWARGFEFGPLDVK